MPAIVDNPIRELAGVDPRALPDAVLRSTTPVVLRGLVDAWTLVRDARASAEEAAAYLQRFHHGTMPANAMVPTPDVDGSILDTERVGEGKSVPVHVKLGGSHIIKQQRHKKKNTKKE